MYDIIFFRSAQNVTDVSFFVVVVGEVASSSSSMTLAFIVAAEEEYSESSSEGVRCKTAFLGGVESNLNLCVKPSSLQKKTHP